MYASCTLNRILFLYNYAWKQCLSILWLKTKLFDYNLLKLFHICLQSFAIASFGAENKTAHRYLQTRQTSSLRLVHTHCQNVITLWSHNKQNNIFSVHAIYTCLKTRPDEQLRCLHHPKFHIIPQCRSINVILK